MKPNTNKKMMVSLCGLALSSLFVLNNKSVVHADAVTDGSQNNAISWNSDSDAAQNVQNTQKADDHQQNVQSVQPSRAETSTVRSSSAAPRTTNQTAAVQSPKISNINDAQAAVPVVINNPAGDKVHVHYVDSNGNAVDNSSHDYDIDATKTGQGSYTVPNGYSLNVPNGNYNVNGSKFGADTLQGNVEHHDARTRLDHIKVGTSTGTKHDVTVYNNGQRVTNDIAKAYLPTDIRNLPDLAVTGVHEKSGVDPRNRDAQKVDIDYKYTKYEDKTTVLSPAYTTQTLPVAFVDSNNNLVGMIQNYSGKVGTTQNVSLTLPTGYKLADGETMPTSVTFANNTNAKLIRVVSNGQATKIDNPADGIVHVKFVDQDSHGQVGTQDIAISKLIGTTGTYDVPKDYATLNNGYSINYADQLIAYNDDSDDIVIPFTSFVTQDQADRLYKDYINIRNKYARKGFWCDVVYLGPNGDTVSDDEFKREYPKYYNAFPNCGHLADVPDSDIVLSVPLTKDGAAYTAENSTAVTEILSDFSQSELQQIYNKFYTLPNVEAVVGIPVTAFNLPQGISDIGHSISGNTVTVPVHKTNSFSFADNSGNVQSVSGNTVDVTLTKPQSVNPAMDKRCQASATRVIHVNFPDGQIPESYKGIVDSRGDLTQTVHFTRTATEDALTGNILQYGSWTSDNQDPNFIGFPERTLPRIPGYTLKITPASVQA